MAPRYTWNYSFQIFVTSFSFELSILDLTHKASISDLMGDITNEFLKRSEKDIRTLLSLATHVTQLCEWLFLMRLSGQRTDEGSFNFY